MQEDRLESLSKETLIKLIKVYSRNWQTLDGQWFGNVEAACGMDTAVEIDLENWKKQAVIEAKRLKEVLGLEKDDIATVLTVLSYMSWQLTSLLFEYEVNTGSKAVIFYRRCAVQEGRNKTGKPVFPCRNMKLTLLNGIASVVNPGIKVKCVSCPPDEPGEGYWCKWELSLAGS